MSEQPIEIEIMYDLDTDNRCAYYCRGHADPARFAAAVGEWTYPAQAPVERVERIYLRWLPRPTDGETPIQLCYRRARGATPITYYEVPR